MPCKNMRRSGTSDDFVRLDDLPADRTLRGFVKIDVEGGEFEVLKGGDRLVSEGAVDILIETHLWRGFGTALFEPILRDFGRWALRNVSGARDALWQRPLAATAFGRLTCRPHSVFARHSQ